MILPPPPPKSYLEVKVKWLSLKVRQIQQKEHFFIMKLFPKSKRSTNVTETLPYFLDCRQVFKEHVQSFIHYKKELFVFVPKTELVFSREEAIRA